MGERPIKSNKTKLVVSLILLTLVIVAGIKIFSPDFIFWPKGAGGDRMTTGEGGDQGGTDSGKDKQGIKEEPIDLRILCVGDVMAHNPQLKAQFDSQSGVYDFSNNFQYIKSYVEQADLALYNNETTFAGGNPSGYPVFNSPDVLASAVKAAGFDLALTSNNHILDKKKDGMLRTLEVLRNAGLQTAGTQMPGEKPYTIVDVKGVQVGVVAYTYETPQVDGYRTLNSNRIPTDAQGLFNTFGYLDLEGDLQKIVAAIAAARTDGAELVVCYFHWGEEYQREPNSWQTGIAQRIADSGADIIFASHPHVLQKAEMLVNSAGKSVPVFYSMGNFISNQREETMIDKKTKIGNRYTEQGMIAGVSLEYMKSTGKILSINMDVLPTWVDRYQKGGKNVYTIVPLDVNMASNPDLAASGHLWRAQQALSDVTALIGEQYIRRN